MWESTGYRFHTPDNWCIGSVLKSDVALARGCRVQLVWCVWCCSMGVVCMVLARGGRVQRVWRRQGSTVVVCVDGTQVLVYWCVWLGRRLRHSSLEPLTMTMSWRGPCAGAGLCRGW